MNPVNEQLENHEVEAICPSMREEDFLSYDWDLLPFLALPDGSHLTDSDTVFFVLPSRVGSISAPLFGIACLKQEIPSTPEGYSRSSVVKSVCALAREPRWHTLHRLISSMPSLYFSLLQEGLTSEMAAKKVLPILHSTLNSHPRIVSSPICSGWDEIAPSTALEALDPSLVLRLMKLLLLHPRLVLHAGTRPTGIFSVCATAIALVKLFPGMLDFLTSIRVSSTGSSFPGDSVYLPKPHSFERVVLGVKDSFWQPRPTQSQSQALQVFHEHCPFLPYVALQQLEPLGKMKGFLCGISNPLFLRDVRAVDAVVDLELGQLQLRKHELSEALTLSPADRRFVWRMNQDREKHSYSDLMAIYLESLLNTSSLLPQDPHLAQDNIELLADWGLEWAKRWIMTHNFIQWRSSAPTLSHVLAPRHPSGPPLPILSDLGDLFQSTVKNYEAVPEHIRSVFGEAASTINDYWNPRSNFSSSLSSSSSTSVASSREFSAEDSNSPNMKPEKEDDLITQAGEALTGLWTLVAGSKNK